MNYIREELTRQQTALNRLLLGGRTEQETEDTSYGRAADWELLAAEERYAGTETAAGAAADRKAAAMRELESAAGMRGAGASDREGPGFAAADLARTEVILAETEPAGVRELSLFVQRDARRYDGGFCLY